MIGIAGGPDKIKMVESLGADKGVDYKSPTFVEDLRAAVGPEGIDRHFENVGGKVLDAIIPLMKVHAKIGLCGTISTYNGGPTELYNLIDLIVKRADIQGRSDGRPEMRAALTLYRLQHRRLHLPDPQDYASDWRMDQRGQNLGRGGECCPHAV